MDIKVGGKVQGIGLESFLQITQMDKTTCTLKIISGKKVGYLFMLDGDLIAAKTKTLSDKEAAFEILGWGEVSIEIDKPYNVERTIYMPLMNLMMEALRLKDERESSEDYRDDSEKDEATDESDITEEDIPIEIDENEIEIETEAERDAQASADDFEIELDDTPENDETEESETPPPPPGMPTIDFEGLGEDDIEDAYVVGEEPAEPKNVFADVKSEIDGIKLEVEGIEQPQEEESEEEVSEDGQQGEGQQKEKAAGADGKPASAASTKAGKGTDTSAPSKTAPSAKKAPEKGDADEKPAKADQKSGKKNLIFAAVAGIIIIFAAGGFFGFQQMKQKEIETTYNDMLAQADALKTLSEKLVVLQRYVNDHPESAYAGTVQTKVKNLKIQIEKEDADKTLEELNALPANENFMEHAGILLEKFNNRHPGSQLKNKLQSRIEEISIKLDETDYETIKKYSDKSYEERLSAYKVYLANHPDGKYRNEVTNLVSSLSDELYNQFKNIIPDCDSRKDWQECMALAQKFRKIFNKDKRLGEIKTLTEEFKSKEEWETLTSHTADMSLTDQKSYYENYLKDNPNTSIAGKIREKMEFLRIKIVQKEDWEKMEDFCESSTTPHAEKIRRLENFIDENRYSPFVENAEARLNELKGNTSRLTGAQKEAERRRKQQIEQQKQQEIALAQKKMAAILNDFRKKLPTVKSRFKDNGNGTVTDTNTGLMWCTVDSFLALGKCINYKDAMAYTNSINTAGYNDWRIPTANELAAIYLGSPYYPSSGAEWYWSSQGKSGAWNVEEKQIILRPDNKKEFERELMDWTKCGAVHPVRTAN